MNGVILDCQGGVCCFMGWGYVGMVMGLSWGCRGSGEDDPALFIGKRHAICEEFVDCLGCREEYFIGRLATHFGLVKDEGIMGLTVIACKPPMIDMDELVKLNIFLGYMYVLDEGVRAVPAPVLALSATLAAAPGEDYCTKAEHMGRGGSIAYRWCYGLLIRLS
ncbi:hypothetical protein Tco_0016261 [Tanacetum coccineum]